MRGPKEFFGRPLGGACLLFLPILFSCALQGVVEPEPVQLGDYHVKILGQLPGHSDPRLAVLWLSVNGRISVWDLGEAALESDGTGNTSFSGKFGWPEPDVSKSGEFVVGKFWLYDDLNGNGRLDLEFPPDYLDLLDSLDRAQEGLREALNRLADGTSGLGSAIGVSDSFLVRDGALFRPSAPSEILNRDPSGGLLPWRDLLRARFRVLFQPGKWEEFFNPEGDFTSKGIRISLDHGDTLVKTCQYQRYHVQKSSAQNFEKVLAEAALKQYALDILRSRAKGKIDSAWKTGSPISTIDSFLGRSTGHYIVYFSSKAARQDALDGQATSAFFFARKDFKVGFNVLECDNEGKCDILNNADSLEVHAGEQSAEVFGFPRITDRTYLNLEAPARGTLAAPTERFDGAYKCPCSDSAINALFFRDSMWIDFPDYGLLPFKVGAGETFFNLGDSLDLEARFTADKLLVTAVDQRGALPDTTRFYALNLGRDPSAVFANKVEERVFSAGNETP